MAHLGFDASKVEPDKGQLDPIPAGWYNAMVDESELKPTADGLGARLSVRFNIVEGQYANRKVYTGFNIRNANPIAQEIAFKQLSALAHAVGVLHVDDSTQLHNIPLKIRVKVVPPKDMYEAKNEPTAYKHINEDVGATGGAKATAAGVAPAPPGIPAPPGGAPTPPAAPAAPAIDQPKQPWEQPPAPPAAPAPPAPPAPPPPPPAPPAAPAFPPEGWVAHPSAAGYFYKGQEVFSEADLRATLAPPAPAAPPAPPAAPVADPAAVAGEASPPWMNKA